MTSPTMLLRTNSTASSPIACRFEGTSWSRCSVTQKKTKVMAAARMINRATRFTHTVAPPRWKHGSMQGQLNSSVVGAWNHGLAWASTALIMPRLSTSPQRSALAEALDDQVEGAREPHEDADHDQPARLQPPVQQPADEAPEPDPGDEVGHHRPGIPVPAGGCGPLLARLSARVAAHAARTLP